MTRPRRVTSSTNGITENRRQTLFGWRFSMRGPQRIRSSQRQSADAPWCLSPTASRTNGPAVHLAQPKNRRFAGLGTQILETPRTKGNKRGPKVRPFN
jgi:hypothetical protein